ncbi:unnamed protein product [Cochlearia groenlandica]
MSTNVLHSSSQALQEQVLGGFVSSRKLLLHNPFEQNNQRTIAAAQSPLITPENNLNGNVLMLLSILIRGIICGLGLRYIIRYAFRRNSSFMISEPISSPPRGSSNKGINKKALKMFPIVSYSQEMNFPGLDEECVICLSDFVCGEKLRLLPKCNHGFHVCCIDKWLQQHMTCPKCRHCLGDTCKKFLGILNEAIQVIVTPSKNVIVEIGPLQSERRVNIFIECN